MQRRVVVVKSLCVGWGEDDSMVCMLCCQTTEGLWAVPKGQAWCW